MLGSYSHNMRARYDIQLIEALARIGEQVILENIFLCTLLEADVTQAGKSRSKKGILA